MVEFTWCRQLPSVFDNKSGNLAIVGMSVVSSDGFIGRIWACLSCYVHDIYLSSKLVDLFCRPFVNQNKCFLSKCFNNYEDRNVLKEKSCFICYGKKPQRIHYLNNFIVVV